jgi:hypothetical protein
MRKLLLLLAALLGLSGAAAAQMIQAIVNANSVPSGCSATLNFSQSCNSQYLPVVIP